MMKVLSILLITLSLIGLGHSWEKAKESLKDAASDLYEDAKVVAGEA